MRDVRYEDIVETVRRLCIEANCELPWEVQLALRRALDVEESPEGKEVLRQILENAEIAMRERLPICQDTGIVEVFVEIGQDVRVVGGHLIEAINEGVRRGYEEGLLRKSVVEHPLRRRNTGDNTPAVVNVEIVKGERLRLIVAPKGAGSENMSRAAVLPPAAGREGVVRFVLETVERAGPNACPPLIVGVGLGGTLEKAAYLAKCALFKRAMGEPARDPEMAAFERELLEEVNKLGIGPGGLGGRVTALEVRVEWFPCHIASLPVAVALQCHAHRFREAVL